MILQLSSANMPLKNNYKNILPFSSSKQIEERKKDWDNASNYWTEIKERGGDLLHREIITPSLKNLFGDLKGCNVLDAGCGEGYYCRGMHEAGANVVGVDFSEKQIEKARSLSNKDIEFICESVTDLKSIKNNSKDKVVTTMVAMYLDDENLSKSLKEFHRVLKPGGELILMTRHPFTTREKDFNLGKPNEPAKLNYLSSYFSKKPFVQNININGGNNEITYYPRTVSELFNSVVNAGFNVKELQEPEPNDKALKKYTDKSIMDNNYLQSYGYDPMVITIKAKKQNR